jgi:hypothetical protein
MSVNKQFFAKVYANDNATLVKNLAFDVPADGSVSVKNPPTFNHTINSGMGECVLDLDTSWDDYDTSVVSPMNVVKLYAVVIDDVARTQTSYLIYTGYMSRAEPYTEADDGVRVTLVGLGSLLSKSYYKNGSAFTVTHSSQDPEAIGKAVIDHFNTIYGGSLIGYSGTTSTVGSSVSVTFTDQKWLDALRKVSDLAGTGWWRKIGEDANYYLQAKSSTPTHRLTVGRDIESGTFTKDWEKVVNDVQVRRSGGTATNYSDATSQSTYGTGSPAKGKSSEVISDTALTDASAADQRGNKDVADNKDAKISGRLVVNSRYPIESIKVGQTVSINNFRSANTFFGSNCLQIVGLTYNAGETVTLELERVVSNFAVALDGFING